MKHRRDIHVLELDRSLCPSDLPHQLDAMVGFDVRPPLFFRDEHGKIVGDDEIEFIV